MAESYLPITSIPALATLPREITSIFARSRFVIPREEILYPLIQFILREKNRYYDFVSAGLSWPLNSVLTIRGMAGIGKTTFAAAVANSTELRQTYNRICFINLGDQLIANGRVNNITYSMYVVCIRDLCRQIGKPPDIFHEEVVYLPGDTALAKAARSLQAIEKVKLQMSKLIDGLSIFLVLDDVWCHEDVELFNFGDGMKSSFSLFVTTRTLDMFPSANACWIDVPLMKPQDAVSLFFLESGRGDPMPTTKEFRFVKDLVKKLGFLPLAVRIAAKVAQAYPDFLCSENNLEDISSTIGTVPDSSAANQSIVHLLNRSFSIVTDADASYAVKICFGAMAVVFYHDDDDIRPWVSQSVVERLWAKLFFTSDYLRPYLLKLREYRLSSMGDITRLLHIMGLIDKRNGKEGKNTIKESTVQIHHDLLWEYGKMVAIQFEKERGGDSKKNRKICSDTHSYSRRNTSEFQDVLIDWNNLMVQCYEDQLYLMESEPYFYCDSHMLHWLPHHMIKARKIKEVFKLLMSKNFLRDRLEFLGILEGTKKYAFDIRALKKLKISSQEGENSLIYNESIANKGELIAVLLLIGNYLSDISTSVLSKDSKVEIGHALVFLGVTEQGFAMWEESFKCFQKGMNIFQAMGLEEYHPFMVSAMGHINSLSVKPMILLPENSENCIRLKYAQKLRDGEYGPSGLPLELSSSPGKGLVRFDQFCLGIPNFPPKSRNIVAGIGPKEGFINATLKGNYLRCTQDGALLSTFNSVAPGSGTIWNYDFDQTKVKGEWIIREDGKISLVHAPNLCLGSCTNTFLGIVARNSLNRAIFKNSKRLKESQVMGGGKDKRAISLVLKSAVNCGIVASKEFPRFDTAASRTLVPLFFGPTEETLSARFTENQEIFIVDFGGIVLRAGFDILRIGNFVQGTRDNCENPRLGTQFEINDDGSISPVKAPHLALGFPEIGTSYNDAPGK